MSARTQSTGVTNVEDIGAVARDQRKLLGLTQREVGELSGVGTRFISELERGKSTIELGRVLRVLAVLGIHSTLGYIVDNEAQ